MKTKPSGSSESFANHEIVTFAVYLLGGDSHYVDTENVAVKVNELAPGRFTWVKYKEQINIGNVRWALWDSKKAENGTYLLGSEKKGWMLTDAGLKFAKERIHVLKSADLTREPLAPKERSRLAKERARLLASEAFAKFQSLGAKAVTPLEAESFFRINAYIVGDAREQKVVRIMNLFGDDPDLGETVRELGKKVLRGELDGKSE